MKKQSCFQIFQFSRLSLRQNNIFTPLGLRYLFIRANVSDPNESAAAIIKIPTGKNSPMKKGNKAAIKLAMPVNMQPMYAAPTRVFVFWSMVLYSPFQ